MNPYRARKELGKHSVANYYHHLHPTLQMRLLSWIVLFSGFAIVAITMEVIKIA